MTTAYEEYKLKMGLTLTAIDKGFEPEPYSSVVTTNKENMYLPGQEHAPMTVKATVASRRPVAPELAGLCEASTDGAQGREAEGEAMSAMPVVRSMCSTCPFRDGVPQKYAQLRTDLAISAIQEASRICHSTGKNNAFHEDTGKPERLCRGARDMQLQYYHHIKFISAPTDEAWNAKCVAMGLPTPEEQTA